MKRLSSRLLCLFAGFTLFTIAVPAQRANSSATDNSFWLGTFAYEEVLKRNPNSGTVETVEYEIMISRKNGGLSARLTASGFQSADDYECTVRTNGNQLSLHYLKDLRPAEMPGLNRHFRQGELLGTLVKTNFRGKTRYVFKTKHFLVNSYSAVFKKRNR